MRVSRIGFLAGFFVPTLYAIVVEVQSWAKPVGGDPQLFGGFLFFVLAVALPAGLVTGGIGALIGAALARSDRAEKTRASRLPRAGDQTGRGSDG